MRQIYCKEGTLCHQYPLEKRKIIKKLLRDVVIALLAIFYLIAVFIVPMVASEQSLSRIIFFYLGLPGLILILSLLSRFVWEILYYRFYFYDTTDKEITIRKGVISRKEVTVPFVKIQDIYVDQDVLDRIFGLYDVHLSTAAVGSYLQAHIDGVNEKNAQTLKNLLIEKTRVITPEKAGL